MDLRDSSESEETMEWWKEKFIENFNMFDVTTILSKLLNLVDNKSLLLFIQFEFIKEFTEDELKELFDDLSEKDLDKIMQDLGY